ncbi:hypothetical protein ElyMa_006298800 [Elysia marginata]|uniref:Endonuclease/exonuclease/phosphatase domain-containing protein n=1 Tax=Elysia marginata TaxID=1093978 RepID=A0AAV4HGB2_9GAST|nr:hypothetical protein ElyMa_006298800 [Elysia marginata]
MVCRAPCLERPHRKLKRIKLLTASYWNGEGITRKKMVLANRLKRESINIACIQESHLMPHAKHGRRFKMKGYQTIKQDRQGGPEDVVITLVKQKTSLPQKLRSMKKIKQRLFERDYSSRTKTSQLTTAAALQERTCSPVHCGWGLKQSPT